MKTQMVGDQKEQILQYLTHLPRKILALQGRENLAEFVLHELSNTGCFNLSCAAYVVDNPDFNCLRGVAGIERNSMYSDKKDIWQEPDQFSEHMCKCQFNQKVRNYSRESLQNKGLKDKEIVGIIAQDLEFEDPSYYAWDMKHDNHGFLIYQKQDKKPCDCDYLLEGLCLIGFCPVF